MTGLLDFIDASPSPFHAVATIRARLEAAGFAQLQEGETWKLTPHQGYFVIRGGKTIMAWIMGDAPVSEAGFRILCAHTDSPTIKIRPNPSIVSANTQWLAVDVHGSPLLYTWLDRDLKLSGVVYVAGEVAGQILTRQVDLAEHPVRAASLAIHLRRDAGESTAGLTVNPQKDLNLLFAETQEPVSRGLPDLLADACGVPVSRMAGYDLRAAEIQRSNFTGADQAFISAPRLDNLFSCYCIAESLLAQKQTPRRHTVAGVWFDAEELGSQTRSGADSDALNTWITRIALSQTAGSFEDAHRAMARSIMLVADMAHAEHPAFKDRTDERHVPQINKGLALKHSPSAHYGDCGELSAWFKEVCRKRGLALQRFAYRCDHGGGSTIGRFTSSHTGIRTIDVGAPTLSMHSARELAGRKDVDFSIAAFGAFMNEPFFIG